MSHIAYISIGMPSTLYGSLETFLSHADIGRALEQARFAFIQLSTDRNRQTVLADDPMPRRMPHGLPDFSGLLQ